MSGATSPDDNREELATLCPTTGLITGKEFIFLQKQVYDTMPCIDIYLNDQFCAVIC